MCTGHYSRLFVRIDEIEHEHYNIFLSLSKGRAYLQPFCAKSLLRKINFFFNYFSIYLNKIYAVVKFFDNVITSTSRFAEKLLKLVVLNSRKGQLFGL